jgi:quinol monooxygenase YgiN
MESMAERRRGRRGRQGGVGSRRSRSPRVPKTLPKRGLRNPVSGKRDEYLKHLEAHAQRCLSTEPGTLKFEILVPKEEADTLMLYEVYASPEAFQAHWAGPSLQQVKQDAAGLQVSLTGVRCDIAE